jgi:hypothetical protein
MGPLVVFIAGGLTALASRRHVKKAAKKAFRSIVEKVEDAKRDLDEERRTEAAKPAVTSTNDD